MKKLIIGASLILSSMVYAGGCDNLYPNAKPVEVPNTVELCNSFYVSRFDTNNRATIATYELLSKAKTGKVARVNAFRADTRVKNSPAPQEYVNTGYDKGHMAPAADASTDQEMSETFLMTNMTPQEPTLNEQSWRLMEAAIRKQFDAGTKDLHILTIAVYDFNTAKRVGKGVPVPTGYYKVVYGDTIDYYFAENKPNAKVTKYSRIDIEKVLGLK